MTEVAPTRVRWRARLAGRRFRVVAGLALATVILGGSTRLIVVPAIVVPQEVPPEVTELVQSTWAAYLAAFPSKHECIGTVELILVDDVSGGRAYYSPAQRQIRIQIPTSPERFPESLAHELGHHLDWSCRAREEIGSEFVRAEDLDPGADWYHGDRWLDVPAEHFAETVVLIVLGKQILHPDIHLSDAAIQLVSQWGWN